MKSPDAAALVCLSLFRCNCQSAIPDLRGIAEGDVVLRVESLLFDVRMAVKSEVAAAAGKIERKETGRKSGLAGSLNSGS
jgi:hypothetical protein